MPFAKILCKLRHPSHCYEAARIAEQQQRKAHKDSKEKPRQHDGDSKPGRQQAKKLQKRNAAIVRQMELDAQRRTNPNGLLEIALAKGVRRQSFTAESPGQPYGEAQRHGIRRKPVPEREVEVKERRCPDDVHREVQEDGDFDPSLLLPKDEEYPSKAAAGGEGIKAIDFDAELLLPEMSASKSGRERCDSGTSAPTASTVSNVEGVRFCESRKCDAEIEKVLAEVEGDPWVNSEEQCAPPLSKEELEWRSRIKVYEGT